MINSWAARSRAALITANNGIVGPHDHRLHVLARLLRAIHDGRHQGAGVVVQFRPAAGGVAALGHLGRHHGHVGGFGVGLRQGLLEHEEIVRGTDRHQFAVGLVEFKCLGTDLLGRLLVELLDVLVMPSAPPLFVDPFGNHEHGQEHRA